MTRRLLPGRPVLPGRMLQLLTGVLLVLTLLVPVAAQPVHADGPVDPRDVALTLADLPPGFSVDPNVTGLTILPDSAGVSLRVDMRRPATPQTLTEGPIIVQQIIVRLDQAIPPPDVLASIRDELIREAGLSPTSEGPNDGGTVSLKRQDGEIVLYSVGFVKQNMVIFTTAGGLEPVTTFPTLVELAGITSARLDANLAGQ